MIEQKKYARRHPGELTSRKLTKSEGMAGGGCMAWDDPRRPRITVRACRANASGVSCPAGMRSASVQRVGFNSARACVEYDVSCVTADGAYAMGDTNVINCCNGSANEAICHPNLCRGSDECKRRMAAICSLPAYRTNAGCEIWMNQSGNEAVRDEIMGARCTSRMLGGDTPCRRWCMNNPGKCDKIMTEYCAMPSGRIDPACVCINSPLRELGEAVAPVACFDDKCVATGYKTSGMTAITNRGCPDFVRCSAVINASDQSILKNAKINQACGPNSNYAVSERERARLIALAEAGQTDVEPSEPAQGGTVSEPPASGPTFREKWNRPIAGALATGDAAVIMFIILIISAILYRQWSAKRKSELTELKGGVEIANQLAEKQMAMVEAQWARHSGKEAAMETAASLKPVGA